VTVVLSAAAALGYLAYRAWSPPPVDPEADTVIVDIAADPEQDALPQTAETLPDFSLGNLAGEPQSIKSWPGKPLLINFWATWCGPCLREIPMLKELQAARPDFQVVGIAIDKRDDVVEFAAQMEFNYAILIGQSEAWAAAAALGVNIYALPFTVFAGADGSILGVHTGELHSEHIDRFRTIADDLAAQRIGLAEARGRMAEAI
jgi:thiol-disulfide isomerase/thioredoxin